jgi:hypothetical protein
MANPNFYNAPPMEPLNFDGVNHRDVDLTGKRSVTVQFDPSVAHASWRLYFRLDQVAAAGGTTKALFGPAGYWSAGGDEEFLIDPEVSETPTLHLLLTDANGTAQTGSADDYVYFLPMQATQD